MTRILLCLALVPFAMVGVIVLTLMGSCVYSVHKVHALQEAGQ